MTDEASENLLNIPELADTKVSPYIGIAALALNMALKWHDMRLIKDGTLYQQIKLENKPIHEIDMSDILETAHQFEKHLMMSPGRLAKVVLDVVDDVANQISSVGKTTWTDVRLSLNNCDNITSETSPFRLDQLAAVYDFMDDAEAYGVRQPDTHNTSKNSGLVSLRWGSAVPGSNTIFTDFYSNGSVVAIHEIPGQERMTLGLNIHDREIYTNFDWEGKVFDMIKTLPEDTEKPA